MGQDARRNEEDRQQQIRAHSSLKGVPPKHTNVPRSNPQTMATMDNKRNLSQHAQRAQVVLSAYRVDSWIMCPMGTCPWPMSHPGPPPLPSMMIATRRQRSMRHLLWNSDFTLSKRKPTSWVRLDVTLTHRRGTRRTNRDSTLYVTHRRWTSHRLLST